EAGMPNHGAGLRVVLIDQWRGVVAQHLFGEPPEALERALNPFQPIVLPLGEEGPAVEPPRVAQDDRHEVDRHGGAADMHDLLAEVDLHLAAWGGLEPDGGECLGTRLLAARGYGALK